jgi:hypothetical protein
MVKYKNLYSSIKKLFSFKNLFKNFYVYISDQINTHQHLSPGSRGACVVRGLPGTVIHLRIMATSGNMCDALILVGE